MNLEDRISIYYTALTKSERRVYLAILENPTVIIGHSIQEASAQYNVSIASIQRFIKKVGYHGYSEFKLDVTKFIREKHSLRDDKPETRLSRIMNGYIQTLDVLKKMNLEKKINFLVSNMHSHKIIKAIGIGNSALSAEQLVYSMYSEDLFIEPVQDQIKVNYLKNVLTDEYFLIIFSITGSSVTYNNLFTAAKKNNAKTFLITMNQESPLLSNADDFVVLPSTHIQNMDDIPYRVDNRTILYNFAEVISYYYATTK